MSKRQSYASLQVLCCALATLTSWFCLGESVGSEGTLANPGLLRLEKQRRVVTWRENAIAGLSILWCFMIMLLDVFCHSRSVLTFSTRFDEASDVFCSVGDWAHWNGGGWLLVWPGYCTKKLLYPPLDFCWFYRDLLGLWSSVVVSHSRNTDTHLCASFSSLKKCLGPDGHCRPSFFWLLVLAELALSSLKIYEMLHDASWCHKIQPLKELCGIWFGFRHSLTLTLSWDG